MKRLRSLSFILLFNALAACDLVENTGQYYVKYEAESIKERTEYTYLIVQTAMDAEHVKFWCKQEWVEEFGPFRSGDELYINVDSPNLDTYLVRIYVKQGKSGTYQLVREGWNQEEYRLE